MKSTAKKLGEKLAVAKDRLMLQGGHGTQKPGEPPWTGFLPCSAREQSGGAGSFHLTRVMGEFSPFRTQHVEGVMQKASDDMSGKAESTEGSKGRRRGSSWNRKWAGGFEQRSRSGE